MCAPGDYPHYREDEEHSVTGFLVSGIAKQFGKFQQGVGTVMDYKHKGSDTDEVSCPGEHHEGNGGIVVYEHAPEVLPFHIKELADRKGPIE